MFSPRRMAQLGLFAASLTFAGCLAVLVAFGPQADPSAAIAPPGSSSAEVISYSSRDYPAQVASFVESPRQPQQ